MGDGGSPACRVKTGFQPHAVTNKSKSVQARYYSSANKQSQELVTQCLLVAAGKIVDDDSVRAEAAVQVTAVMNTNSVQNKLRIG